MLDVIELCSYHLGVQEQTSQGEDTQSSQDVVLMLSKKHMWLTAVSITNLPCVTY